MITHSKHLKEDKLSEKVVVKLLDRAFVLMYKKQFDQALSLCKIAKDINSTNPEIAYVRGRINFARAQEKINFLEQAIVDFRLAVDTSSNTYVYYLFYLKALSLSITLYEIHNVLDKETLSKIINHTYNSYEQAIKKFPKEEELYILLAGIYFERNELNKSLQYFKQLIEIAPHNLIASYFIHKIEKLFLEKKEYVKVTN